MKRKADHAVKRVEPAFSSLCKKFGDFKMKVKTISISQPPKQVI